MKVKMEFNGRKRIEQVRGSVILQTPSGAAQPTLVRRARWRFDHGAIADYGRAFST
jgi:hypothetical protein